MTEADLPFVDARARTDHRAQMLLDLTAFMKTRQDVDLMIRWLKAFKGLLPEETRPDAVPIQQEGGAGHSAY